MSKIDTTNIERQRRFQEKAVAIDQEIDEALEKIDWNRRAEAEKSFWNWLNVYGYPSLLIYAPPKKSKEVADKMESSLNIAKPLQLQLARGTGKSVLCQLFILFLIATGKRHFPVIISANARASTQLLQDIFRFVVEEDTAFSQDYPLLHMPHALCHGSYRRRQLYNGKPTNISKTAADLSFADLEGKTTQSHIAARSITGGLRGLRKGSQRPDFILLDDLLGDEDITEETTGKLMDIINKSVMNLGGQTQKLPAVMTSTPLGPEDLTQKIKSDKNWTTVCFPSVISWGDIESEAMARYWELYDDELALDKPHDESDEFWNEHKNELEAGFELYNPDCYTQGENVSGVQALMQKRRLIGPDAFDCEYQLKPRKFSLAMDVSAQDVLGKIGSTSRLEIPDGARIVVSSWDLNVSHCLTNSVVAFDSNMTATVVFHEIFKCRIPSTLPEQQYHRAVYDLLAKYSARLKELGIKIDFLGIDAGGANFDAVCDFAKHSSSICGIPAAAFVGRASHVWNANVKSRLRAATGRAVLCGDDTEKAKAGAGRKWVAWDSDFGRMSVLKAVQVAPYGSGGLMLYNGSVGEHREFATQLTNEKLVYVTHKQDGRDLYNWKTKSALDHDYFDTVAQAYAVAWTNNFGTDLDKGVPTKKKLFRRKQFRII